MQQVSIICETIEKEIYISVHVWNEEKSRYLNESEEPYKSENMATYL